MEFDRQTVTVPARNVGCIEASAGTGLYDNILEDLVESGSHVNMPVGIGRSVVEDELRFSRSRLTQASIDPEFFPPLDSDRFLPRKVGFHGEGGAG